MICSVLTVGVLGQLLLEVNNLPLGVIDNLNTLQRGCERTLVGVVKDYHTPRHPSVLTQGEDGGLGELRGVVMDDGGGLLGHSLGF